MNPRFRLLWAANTSSGLGSWLLIVAVPFHVYALTGSAAATGLTLALESLPALLLGPWAGVLLDRWNPARALYAADLTACAAVALLAVADRPGRLWVVYLAVLVERVAATVAHPAARVLRPAMVGTGPELAAANSVMAATGSVLRLGAPPLGALLLAGPGLPTLLAVTCAAHLGSAALAALLARRVRATAPDGPARPLTGLRDGVRLVARLPALRGPLAGNTVFLAANAGLTALLVPFTVDRLDAPGHAVGYLISGLGAGYLLGAAVTRLVLDRHDIRRVLTAAQLGTAAAFLAFVNAPDLWWAVAAAVLIGLPGSVLLVSVETHVQRTAPPGTLGRIAGLFQSADAAAAVIGALAAPALVAVLGLGHALNALAAAALLAVPVTMLGTPSAVPVAGGR